jgi:hypothetical protein
VYFHFAAKEFEVLRLQRELARAETGKHQSHESPMHTVSLMTYLELHRQNQAKT